MGQREENQVLSNVFSLIPSKPLKFLLRIWYITSLPSLHLLWSKKVNTTKTLWSNLELSPTSLRARAHSLLIGTVSCFTYIYQTCLNFKRMSPSSYSKPRLFAQAQNSRENTPSVQSIGQANVWAELGKERRAENAPRKGSAVYTSLQHRDGADSLRGTGKCGGGSRPTF